MTRAVGASAEDSGVEVILETADRRPRHHRAQRGRRRGRAVGPRQRVPAHARRPRGARLLRRPQPGVHGRQVRRRRAPPTWARAPATARRSWRRSPPTTPGCPLRILGLGLDDDQHGRGRRVPAHRREAEPAGRRSRHDPRARASRPTICCSTTCARTWAWSGSPRTCGSRTCTVDSAAARARLRPGGGEQARRDPVAGGRGCGRPPGGAGAAAGRRPAGLAVRHRGRRRGGGAGGRLVAAARHGRGPAAVMSAVREETAATVAAGPDDTEPERPSAGSAGAVGPVRVGDDGRARCRSTSPAAGGGGRPSRRPSPCWSGRRRSQLPPAVAATPARRRSARAT